MHLAVTTTILLQGCSRVKGPNPDQKHSSSKGSDGELTDDVKLVDDFLAKWDQFAQGANELIPFINQNVQPFEAALTRMLDAGDRRAPGRLVFYAVVQVGGFIPLDSELGNASARWLGDDFPVFTSKNGTRAYFAGELYFWWQANREKYEPFPLFDEWSKREFARTVVVPMYTKTRERG
jgi:hypothetical protein